MADQGVFLSKSKGFGGGTREERDFDEDLWGVVAKERNDFGPKITRNFPRAKTSSTSDSPLAHKSSAPVDIPDWSKVYGKNCMKGSRDGGVSHNGDEGDDEDDDDMVPPHEWLARKLARSQISSFSVCEGMGRTLKGRDLSKVRNAVLTKTGFIE
ncbi:protein S40-5-like [Lotus japonicus]|uniref:protein S40-5-like n=1 Tax=Lotus japonicus TaxID=34305 RepID=UPI0025876944|nr:protein S40-5-like [Lotus japonicus]